MTQIGLDTSVLIGLLDPLDVWHAQAVTLKQAMKARGDTVVVFDCVLAEAIATMSRRVHEKRRAADLDALLTRLVSDYPTEDILWLFPDVPRLYLEIIELVRSSAGELNFNDALIALSCRNRSIQFLASFDRDFDTVPWLTRVTHADDLGD